MEKVMTEHEDLLRNLAANIQALQEALIQAGVTTPAKYQALYQKHREAIDRAAELSGHSIADSSPLSD